MDNITIENICEQINTMFDNVRGPFPQLPRELLACAMELRPGLSVIQSTGNVVKELNRLGIPTGPMPDGSANLTVAVVYCIIKEVFRALQEDASVQGGMDPESLAVQVGPLVGGNITSGKIKSKIN